MGGLSLRYLALPEQDLVLSTLLLGYLALHGLLLAFVLLRALGLSRQLRLSPPPQWPTQVEVGRPYPLPRWVGPWRYFPWVQVEERVDQPATDPSAEATIFCRRGMHSQWRCRWRVSDLLGLCQMVFERQLNSPLQILPSVGKLAQQPLISQWVGGDEFSHPCGDPQGDRVDMRQYTPGDSPRTILWKVYARTRRLMVRIPERALATRPRTCAYLVTGSQDEAAAALCRVMLEGNLLGPEWRFGCGEEAGFEHAREAALTRLCRSGSSCRPHPAQLAAYLAEAAKDGYAQAVVVLPVELDRQAATVLNVLSQSPIPIRILLASDEPAALSKARLTYRGLRWPMALIDRANGQAMSLPS